MCICVRYDIAQASDGGSTTASTSGAVVPRKSLDSFPTSGVPLLNNGQMGLGGSLSPVPCLPSNSGPAPPAPSPAPAALPPPSLPPPYSTAPLQVRDSCSALHNFTQTKNVEKNSACFNCVVDYSLYISLPHRTSSEQNSIMLFPWCASMNKTLL